MRSVCYGEITTADKKSAAMFRRIDNECSECIYEAGKIATCDVLAAVIENELTSTERDAVKLYWFKKKKISEIAELSGTSYDYIRRVLKRAEKKIYDMMKYVVLHDYLICPEAAIPADFHFKIINCVDGKELIS